MRAYSKKDVDRKALQGARIAILGYGSQGRAHALNLKDSGYDVVVGVRRTGDSWKKAKKDGLAVAEPAEAVKGAALAAMMTPDLAQPLVYKEIVKTLPKGAALLFAHGFNIHFKQIKPRKDLDVVLIAPKGPGDLVRRQFQQGRGVPCLIAIAQNATGKAKARALAYADGIGGTRAAVIETTFAEETETDLFGEQAVLCGGVSKLVQSGFEVLTEAGYQPEVAYFECMHELKLIVDLFYQGGLNYMRYSVSDTAEWGDYVAGSQIINDQTRAAMKQLLANIQSGAFAEEWIEENHNGRPTFNRMRAADTKSQLEQVGAELRRMMPFVNPKEVIPGQGGA